MKMGKYQRMSTPELRSLWEAERTRLLALPSEERDYDALYAMRRELERRGGEPLPGVEVNYDDYLTD